ncbi:hypothetical protein CF319_g9632 [Tilletia indica]|nr:hypothetical protein CF319_g9632 [Tilletia indica]
MARIKSTAQHKSAIAAAKKKVNSSSSTPSAPVANAANPVRFSPPFLSPSQPIVGPSSAALSQFRGVAVSIYMDHAPRDLRPDTPCLREIIDLQYSWKLILPKAAFRRIVKDIAFVWWYGDYRWEKGAVDALQEATEAYLVDLFEKSFEAAAHAGRKTLLPGDMHLTRRLMHELLVSSERRAL